MIISISGDVGSGKSTLAKKLAKRLGFKRYSMGRLQRKMAKARGITLKELDKLEEKNPLLDREVDGYQRRLGQTKDNFVIDGRTSFYFIPQSVKIYLKVSSSEGARRVLKDLENKKRKGEANFKKLTLNGVRNELKVRQASENRRYQGYYRLNIFDLKNYDLVVDTTSLTISQVFKKVCRFLRPYLLQRKMI